MTILVYLALVRKMEPAYINMTSEPTIADDVVKNGFSQEESRDSASHIQSARMPSTRTGSIML